MSTVETDMIASETMGMTVDEIIAKNKTLPKAKRLILDPSDYTLDRAIDPRSVSRADDSKFGNQNCISSSNWRLCKLVVKGCI